MKLFNALTFIALLVPGVLSASLQWDTTAATLQPTPEQSFAEASFPFKNPGPDPVSILAVNTSCTCVTTSSVVGAYETGQSGVLKVRFNVGSKLGVVNEHVIVQTTDKANATVNLLLTVNIPVVFRIEPDFLMWDTNGPADAREVYFYDFTQKGIKPTAVYSTDSNFTAVIVPEPDQHRYAIRVTPASTEADMGAPIYLDIDIGGGKIRKARFLAAIKAPGSQRIRVSQ